MHRHLTKLNLKIENLHCGNCEVLVERKFKSVPGVQKVSVSHVTGRAEIFTTRADTRLEEFNKVIQSDGYSAHRWETKQEPGAAIPSKSAGPDYGQIVSMFFFVFAAYLLLNQFNLIPDGPGFGKNMSYG